MDRKLMNKKIILRRTFFSSLTKTNCILTASFQLSFWYMGTHFKPYMGHRGIKYASKGRNMVLNGNFFNYYRPLISATGPKIKKIFPIKKRIEKQM